MSPSDPGEIDIKTDVLIVGGGMVGMATAIALGGAGLEVLVVDAEPAAEREGAGYDGRSSAIAFASQQALAQLGIWQGMAPEAEPILDIRVSDGRPGRPAAPLFLHYDHLQSGLGALRPYRGERVIRRALAARLAELPNVTVVAPGTPVESSAGQAMWRRGSRTDGGSVPASRRRRARSKLRQEADRAAEFAYGQTGIVATVAHELPHGGVAA
jgi:2-octaprenyl-6-methoxyphenol hydroxylase